MTFDERKAAIAALEVGNGIESLLQRGRELLGNPLLANDTSYRLIGYTPVETDDRLWREIIANNGFSHETVDFFVREGFVQAFAESDVVAYMESPSLEFSRYNGKLFDADGVQLANVLMVEFTRPFEQGDDELLEAFCEVASLELRGSEVYNHMERVYEESTISRLIMGDKQIDTDRWDPDASLKMNIYIAVIDISQYDHTVTHLAYFRDLFRELQPGQRFYVHKNNVVALISTDEEFLDVGRELAPLCSFFQRYDICAGVSRRFQNIFELEHYYQQALNALNYGAGSGRKQPFHLYDNYCSELFLNEIKDTVDLGRIIHPLVHIIRERDITNGTDYLGTLLAYLLYGCDIALASNALGIHAVVLEERIAELCRLYALDIKDGNVLCGLLLSIKLLNSVEL